MKHAHLAPDVRQRLVLRLRHGAGDVRVAQGLARRGRHAVPLNEVLRVRPVLDCVEERDGRREVPNDFHRIRTRHFSESKSIM